ncbi:MAG: hypothetical protein AB2L14_31035 [Candidatus Xenobiia bacterium LiM19]
MSFSMSFSTGGYGYNNNYHHNRHHHHHHHHGFSGNYGLRQGMPMPMYVPSSNYGCYPNMGMYGNMSTGMIGYPQYGYCNPNSRYNEMVGGVAGGTLGAGFGGLLGLGLSDGDPGWGLVGTLLGAGLGYSAGRNLGSGRY